MVALQATNASAMSHPMRFFMLQLLANVVATACCLPRRCKSWRVMRGARRHGFLTLVLLVLFGPQRTMVFKTTMETGDVSYVLQFPTCLQALVLLLGLCASLYAQVCTATPHRSIRQSELAC